MLQMVNVVMLCEPSWDCFHSIVMLMNTFF